MKPASIAATITVLFTSATLLSLSSCTLGAFNGSSSPAESDSAQASEDTSKSDTKGTQRAKEGRISIELPDGWTENPNFKPTMNGFTTSWANDQENPTDIARMSSNQGQGPTAMANMGYFEANAQFSTTHGTEFELGKSRDLKITNADEAKLTTWTTNGSKGETVKGAWVFVSSGTGGAAGLEIMATTLSEKEIEKIIDSVEFNPEG
ncbi:hypothetical protein [Corynebacterium meitnerae]|uniref:Secreted protein n=1 Tax=Corynebacterium meitnerae TaxID=2913498 RepID=A0A9X3LVL6_9CORY|nr:hypothetical protein [Corynebacterium meitnerae]MCZ9293980.1 hypothetical protein [Corynebacterium meitnerae]